MLLLPEVLEVTVHKKRPLSSLLWQLLLLTVKVESAGYPESKGSGEDARTAALFSSRERLSEPLEKTGNEGDSGRISLRSSAMPQRWPCHGLECHAWAEIWRFV